MANPLITIAVVCLNEEKHIFDCLRCLLMQSFPAKFFEILVVDNDSTDETPKIVKQFQKRSSRIRLVVNHKRGIAASRNVALSLSKGKLLAFTDADCLPAKNWLASLLVGYSKYKTKDQGLVGVGGPNIPPKNTRFYQALGIMLDSFLGSRGSVQARRYSQDRPVSHLSCANVLYEKKQLTKIGGFDESLGSIIEDEDLSYRLTQAGYHLYYLAKAVVVHQMRSNMSAWTRNMFVYGRGRMLFLKKHPEKWHFYFVLPVLLVLLAPILLPLYLPLILIYSFALAAKNKRTDLVLRIFILFVVTHFFYGVGEIYGGLK